MVHLDDFYPGWHGLAAGAHMVADTVLRSENPGYLEWDWETDQPGEWVALDPAQPLIVEGVGALTHASLRAARLRGPVLTIQIDCPDELRKERALQRDPEFAPWWEVWAEQERTLLGGDTPEADIVVPHNVLNNQL